LDEEKKHKLNITGGYIYDQIGSGALFRAYEARPLAIDNALVGARVEYKFGDNFSVKGFAGKQKKVEKQPSLAAVYGPVIAGASAEGFIDLSDSTGKNNITLVPGAGVVRRTLDDETMNQIVSDISSYPTEDRFIPKYTTYAFAVYNTLTWNRFNWFVEGAYKTEEAINALDPQGRLRNFDGYNIFTSLSYSLPGFAVTAQYKRTDHFVLRTSPLQTLNRGQIAFLPPMARQNTYRLQSRYNAATQEVGEQAFQLDVLYSPIKTKDHKLSLLLNVSNIFFIDSIRQADFTPDEKLLYREVYFESTYKFKRKWKLIAGYQFQQYNQELYEVKPGVPIVMCHSPFLEFAYRIDRKKSIRAELQYMATEQDFGSWAYGLVEFNIAPNWSFTITDMINVDPKKYSKVEHFYTALVTYKKGSSRFGLSYVRQVEGIVCTGGVCRYEPAFNGVRFELNSTF